MNGEVGEDLCVCSLNLQNVVVRSIEEKLCIFLDTQGDTQGDRQTDRHRDRKTETETETETDRHRLLLPLPLPLPLPLRLRTSVYQKKESFNLLPQSTTVYL